MQTCLSTCGETFVGKHRGKTFLVVGHQVLVLSSLQILSKSLKFLGFT